MKQKLLLISVTKDKTIDFHALNQLRNFDNLDFKCLKFDTFFTALSKEPSEASNFALFISKSNIGYDSVFFLKIKCTRAMTIDKESPSSETPFQL
ncbi:hypothetical protein LX77_01782 [Gelidibacter algens]|uniref:Uncharacterized protein n=1 Tax=Gelidibacter algens TaxID=49280 RepID=A0A327S6Y4_9FLAO|nr:hypothetical protein LX77_01782 [Gelidibacter algens]